MRIKKILSIIAFVAAFGFSLTLAGLPQNNLYSRYVQRQTRHNILTLLQQDIDNGSLLNQRIRYYDARAKRQQSAFDIAEYADATSDYVESSSNMDDTSLPADFRAAWQKHMAAWRAHADFSIERRASGIKYKIIDGEIVQLAVESGDENVYQKQVDEIDRTWYETLRVGRKYGAFVDEY